MNLPFFGSREEARRKTLESVAMAPTRLVTSASMRKELIPPVAKRYEAETPRECLIYGFIDGLYDVGFDLKVLAMIPDIMPKLTSNSFELPDFIWQEINQLSCEQQAWVIYVMMRYAQAWVALRLAREPEKMAGKEHLALPLELAGEENFLQILREIRPVLEQLGLNKGQTRGEGNGVDYPTVLNVFLATRERLCKTYSLGLKDFRPMARFILALSQKLDYWPDEATAVFRDSETMLNAIDGIKKAFLIPRLHPQYFRRLAD